MNRLLVVRAVSVLLVLVCMFGNVLAQTGNGGLTGTVEDTSKALIPGVSITATNTETGVATTVITNESGAYNIPSLLPGTYKLTAELAGFRAASYTNIALGTNETKRFNFTLEVGAVATAVEVTIDATALLTTSSATIGEVLPEYRIRDLPVVGNDVLDLVRVMPGYRAGFGFIEATFAGIGESYVSTTVNGQSVQDGRYAAGVYSTTRINPDMVSEIRLVLTPVDAEMGRGNGQVQIQTRSGTNEYRGSAVWNGRNTALDARSWTDNRSVPLPPRGWNNQHQYTLSYGGPIVKNKTFFFALWDGQIVRIRDSVAAMVLTDCARNGIFRYFPDWNNGNTITVPPTIPTTSGTAATPVVDVLGNPKAPATFRDGRPYTGTLQYASVFGQLQNIPTKPDCSDAVVTPNTAWDSLRSSIDQTGFAKKILDMMPRANSFDATTGFGAITPDGLNTAFHRWSRPRKGNDDVSGGTSDDTERKQINIRIDHNFNAKHKVAGNWSYERDNVDNSGPNWPGGFWGSIQRRPYVITTNFTSTLSPTLVNEARFGMRYNKGVQYQAMDDPQFGEAARKFMPTINGLPVVVGLGVGGLFAASTDVNFRSSVLSFDDFSRGNTTVLSTYADTLSWTKAQHAFRFGGELRRSKSDGYSNLNLIPRATGGAGQLPLPTFSDSLQGLLTSNNTRMQNLLAFLSGSIGTVNQLYFLKSADRLDNYEDIRTAKNRGTDVRQNEWSAFFKDDWKVHNDLTLNLGLRYEYYGSPWEDNGLTTSPVGGGFAAFGYSGRSFQDWFRPGPGLRSALTTFEFVGPNSPNPGRSLWPADRNNFGPAVGFAWQLPWFGKDKTTLRGGYQITYQGGGRGLDLDIALGYAPGMIFTPNLNAGSNTFVTLSDITNSTSCGGVGCVPVPHNVKPMQPIPVEYRATISGWLGGMYDPNYVAPYIQNFNLAVTRSVGRNMTVDVRYIGTRGLKLFADLPLNSPNFLTNGLKEAFDAARSGEESELLDRIFSGMNIAGAGFGQVGSLFQGVRQTGAMHLRASTASCGTGCSIQSALANGNYSALAGALNTLNYNRTFSGNAGLPVIPTSVQGTVLRQNGFPENFIVANPQFSTVALKTNLNNSNYHAMQAQFTLRPTAGFNYQGTFTWSRTMASPPQGGFAHLPDRIEYGLTSNHRLYDFRSNGGFELPIGPGKWLLRSSSGWLARLVERWQASAIVQLNSGAPITIGAPAFGQNMMTNTGFGGATGTPVITPEGVAVFGKFPSKFGHVTWKDGAAAGTYFPDDMFVRVDDPQCGRVTSLQNLNGLGGTNPVLRCTLDAIARPLPAGKNPVPGHPDYVVLPDGRPGLVVLRNPLPGERGTLGLNTMEGPGVWLFDAAMSKTIQIAETKSVQFRVDSTNILNHPAPNPPSLDLNPTTATPFGNITSKGGFGRRFQATVRVNF